MKTTRLSFVLIPVLMALSFTANGQDQDTARMNGFKQFFYPGDKVVSSEGTMVNGRPDGYWKAYYENGKMKSEGTRTNGSVEGVWKFYNEDGKQSAQYV